MTGTLGRRFARTAAGAAALAIGAFAAATPQAARAGDLRIALGLPEVYAAYGPLTRFAEDLKTTAGLAGKVYAMSLLTLAETAGGVRDGLADVGFVVFPYHPVEFSEVNLAANLSMLATTGTQVPFPGAAAAGASMEYTLLNCPDCLAQMQANNQVYVAGASTTPYRLLCTKPIASAEDVKGRKFRAGAANYARWAEALGGASVSVPGNETYDAMSQGVVDCTMSPLGDLIGGQYIDVSSHVTLAAPGGTFPGLGAANFNRDVWLELDEEQRAAVLKAGARLAAGAVYAYAEDDAEGLAAARKKGVEILEGDDGLKAATEAFVKADVAAIAGQFKDKYKVQDVDAKIATFSGLVEKWKGLTEDLGEADADKLADLYWTEILSKVDPKTYAMD